MALEQNGLPFEMSRVAELNEARAYKSLIQAPKAEECSRLGLRAVSVGSAVAIMADGIRSSLTLNRVIGLGMDEPITAVELDRVVALYSTTNAPFALEISPLARAENIKELLQKYRIRRVGAKSAIFAHDLKSVPSVENEVRIERIGTEHSEQFASICCEAFQMPAETAVLLRSVGGRSEWRQWMVFDGDVPAGAALSYVEGPWAWLGWAATLPNYRGRGFHSAYLTAAMREAAHCGCEWFTSETAVGTANKPDQAYRNYGRLGFDLLYERTTFMGYRPSIALST